MKITINIDEDEVKEAVMRVVISQLAEDIVNEWRSHSSYRFHIDTKAIMREAIKDRMDVLTEAAVDAAATTIANKAIKEKLNKLME